MLGDGIAADGGALHSELHTKATMRKKRRGQRSSKQGKRQERSTTCGVFLGNTNIIANFALRTKPRRQICARIKVLK